MKDPQIEVEIHIKMLSILGDVYEGYGDGVDCRKRLHVHLL